MSPLKPQCIPTILSIPANQIMSWDCCGFYKVFKCQGRLRHKQVNKPRGEGKKKEAHSWVLIGLGLQVGLKVSH